MGLLQFRVKKEISREFLHEHGILCVREAEFVTLILFRSRSHWPRGLRHGSAAACLLGVRVRISPRCGCLSVVNVVCCQVEGSAWG
jgi:hypothetical protein